jgi:hypothetical protein
MMSIDKDGWYLFSGTNGSEKALILIWILLTKIKSNKKPCVLKTLLTWKNLEMQRFQYNYLFIMYMYMYICIYIRVYICNMYCMNKLYLETLRLWLI